MTLKISFNVISTREKKIIALNRTGENTRRRIMVACEVPHDDVLLNVGQSAGLQSVHEHTYIRVAD